MKKKKMDLCKHSGTNCFCYNTTLSTLLVQKSDHLHQQSEKKKKKEILISWNLWMAALTSLELGEPLSWISLGTLRCFIDKNFVLTMICACTFAAIYLALRSGLKFSVRKKGTVKYVTNAAFE